MQYQSFPGIKGSSRSWDKLKALRLPKLAGKRFLDIGCNEGFFCGYAMFDGAARVLGIDRSREAIQKASLRFPDVEFVRQSWDSLPEGPFDVIILLSALHYAEDQEALIHRLMGSLSDDGLLVLEISMAPGGEDRWVKVERSIDERFFPTRAKLGTMLSDYAWKVIGHSVKQPGDPLQRYVVHVRKLQPYAYLLMGTPGSGKTTISRRLFMNQGVPVVSGDKLYYQIASHKNTEVSEGLRQLIEGSYTSASIDKVTRSVFQQGFAPELVELWSKEAGFCDFALDSYVPKSERQRVKDLFLMKGFFPIEMNWQTQSPIPSPAESDQRVTDFKSYLEENSGALAGQRTVRVDRCVPADYQGRIAWHLDSPMTGQGLDDSGPLKVSGWVVPRWEVRQLYQVFVKHIDGEELNDPNRMRKDVLKSVYGVDDQVPAFWRSHPCGFSFSLSRAVIEAGCTVGIQVDDKRIPLVELSFCEIVAQKPPSMASRLLGKIKNRY